MIELLNIDCMEYMKGCKDNDKDYYDAACERFDLQTRQEAMFWANYANQPKAGNVQ